MEHIYTASIIWTGNKGQGTRDYRSYARDWDIAVPGKPVIHCSNDPLLGGDSGKMNPEDLLLSALSACHMLWYLHYAADAGVTVISYCDTPTGRGIVEAGGAGRFLEASLAPQITVAAGTDLAQATALHDKIHKVCFIARSVNFPVTCHPAITISGS